MHWYFPFRVPKIYRYILCLTFCYGKVLLIKIVAVTSPCVCHSRPSILRGIWNDCKKKKKIWIKIQHMTALPEAAKCFIRVWENLFVYFPLLFREDEMNDFVLLCLLCFLLSYVCFSAYARSMLNTSEVRFTSVTGSCNFRGAWF